METTQQKELPLEVLWGIFKYLDLKTLLDVCPYVSRSWNKAAMHDVFWAQVYARIWGHTNGQGEKALPPPPTANETAASTNSRHNHHNSHHYEDLLSVSDNSDSDDSDEDSDNFSDVDSDDGIASAGDVEMAEGSDNDDVINDVINSQPNSKILLPLCSCSSTHHAGGSPICPSWRGSVIARLRCERVVGGRSGRWGSHALVPSALACEATSDADDDDDNDNNNSSNSSGKEAAPGSSGENENARRQGRYRNQQRDAALRDFDKLRDGVVDMATWAAKKLPFVPVDFCPGLELMLNSNSDDVARVRDPQVAPFDWVSREAFCGREHVSEPEAILGTALEVVSLAECRFPGLAKAFAGAFRRAVQPVLAVLKLRYRSGSAKYLDGLVTRTLALLRDSELDGRDKVYAMFYSALLCFEYGRYLIETRFDIDYHAKIIRMRGTDEFSEEELHLDIFVRYDIISKNYFEPAKSIYTDLIARLKAKETSDDNSAVGYSKYTPAGIEELNTAHIQKNLGDIYAYEAIIAPTSASLTALTHDAFAAYKAAYPRAGPSALYATALLHVSLADRTTGAAAVRHLDEAERILSPFEAERWNPWNLTLVAQTLGRVRTERALLALSHSVRDAEASFLSARATYHQSLRHEPAQQNTHSSASMKVYRTSRGERGRLPLASCGLVTDDVGVLLARGRHEVCHARFAMPRNAAYASVLLAQAGVMFGMAAGLDPRSPAPVAGAAAVLAENALLLSGNDNNEVKMTKGAENMFAAVTDVAGVFGPPSYDEGTCAQVYLDYAAFLVFSAVSATAVKEDEEDSKKKMRQKLVDGLTAALMAMNMGNGYEPAPVFMAAYAAFLLDKVDLCAALISRFNSIVECEDGSRPLSPEVFSTAARDSFDMNEFFWRLSL